MERSKLAKLLQRLVLVSLLVAGCCTSQVLEAKKIRVGATTYNMSEPFYVDLAEGWKDAAKDFGVELTFTSAEGDLGVQLSQVENFITDKMDAVIIIPVDSKGIVSAVEAANSAGIPVFTSDTNAEGGKIVSFVTGNNYLGGVLASELMATALDREGEIVILDSVGIGCVQLRIQGFENSIKARCPRIKILQKINVGFTRDAAMKAAEDMMLAWPNLKGIFGAVGGDAGLGALAAVQAAGRDIKVVSFDALPEMRQNIYDGMQNAAGDVAQFPYKIGYVTIQNVVKYLNGKKVPKHVDVEVAKVTKDNLVKKDGKILIKGYED